jgi:hypothetical protein
MFVGIKSILIKGVYLPYREVTHGLPLHNVDDVIRCIVFWPWNQSNAYM